MNGSKQYEFRKRICRRKVDKILIYSTKPIMKVVGEAEVEDILIDEPEKIWEKTKKKSGIDKNFFDEYYLGKSFAVAFKLKNVIKYNNPKELSEYGILNAPQSFQYLQDI